MHTHLGARSSLLKLVFVPMGRCFPVIFKCPEQSRTLRTSASVGRRTVIVTILSCPWKLRGWHRSRGHTHPHSTQPRGRTGWHRTGRVVLRVLAAETGG